MSERLKALLVFVIPLAVFSSNLNGGWILDDHFQIEQNAYVKSFEHLPRILTTRVWESTSKEARGSDIYRPVFLLSFLVDYHLFGARPFWFHLVSNLLHAVNGLLLFFLIRRFVPSSVAVLGTLLFGLHPVNVEAVTWVSARADLLTTFFALSNVHLAFKILNSGNGTPALAWVLYALTIPLGLFSKENFALIPFLVPLTFVLTKPPWQTKGKRLLILVAGAVVFTGVCLVIRERVVGLNENDFLFLDYLKNGSSLLKRFFLLLVVPSDTDFFFAYQYAPFSWKTDFPLLLFFTGVIALAVWCWRRTRGFLLGVALFLGTLMPVAMVVASLGLIGERYFYLPMAGFSLALSTRLNPALGTLKEKGSSYLRRGLWVSIALWLAFLAGATLLRNREWHDEVQLFNHSAARDAGNFIPYHFLGWHYLWAGDRDAEIRSYYETLKRNPDHLPSLNNLGVRFVERGEYDKAEKVLRHALEVDPKRTKTSYNLGYLFESRGDRAGAERWYREALKMDGSYALAKSALARVSAPSRLDPE